MANKTINRKKKRNNLLRFFEYRILHIDDSPHKIALGLAIGIFVAGTPTLGIRLWIIIALSILLRANKVAGLVSVWISNVFTYVPICYFSYLIGRGVFNIFAPDRTMSKEQVAEYLNKLFAPASIVTGFFTRQYWREFWNLTMSIGPELWIGGFVLGGLVAASSYIVCYNLVKAHRAKNPHRRYEKY